MVPCAGLQGGFEQSLVTYLLLASMWACHGNRHHGLIMGEPRGLAAHTV